MSDIETVDQLNALPVGSVARHVDGEGDATVMEKAESVDGRRRWFATGQKQPLTDIDVSYLVPAQLLWSPS